MKRWWSGIFLFASVLLLAQSALANPTNWYSTTTSTGAENSTKNIAIANKVVAVIMVENFATTAEEAMCFDSATLPGNGAVPAISGALPAAPTSSASNQSAGLPSDGYQVQTGFVCACSTTPKTLTVDTTSGGVCRFYVGWNR